MPELKPKVYTTAEAARVLKIGINRIYELVASGDLPSIRVGKGRRRILIPEKALDEWLDREVKATDR